MPDKSLQDRISEVPNAWTFLHEEWERRLAEDECAIIPTYKLENHIEVADIDGQRYLRFGQWSHTFEFDGLSVTIPASSPWFCLELTHLITEGRFEDAEDNGFMICPECGSHEFVHTNDVNWFEDACEECGESWHAIGYSWINTLMGVWLLNYGDYLSD